MNSGRLFKKKSIKDGFGLLYVAEPDRLLLGILEKETKTIAGYFG
jgi:hypothetical protein